MLLPNPMGSMGSVYLPTFPLIFFNVFCLMYLNVPYIDPMGNGLNKICP